MHAAHAGTAPDGVRTECHASQTCTGRVRASCQRGRPAQHARDGSPPQSGMRWPWRLRMVLNARRSRWHGPRRRTDRVPCITDVYRTRESFVSTRSGHLGCIDLRSTLVMACTIADCTRACCSLRDNLFTHLDIPATRDAATSSRSLGHIHMCTLATCIQTSTPSCTSRTSPRAVS